MAYSQGILLPASVQNQLPKTQFGIAQLWFVNRTPLTSRLPKLPVGNVSFSMVGYKFRPRALTLAATITTGDTTFTLGDTSPIQNGDVLLMSTGEAVEVTAAPNNSANTVAVRRAVGTDISGVFTHVAATAIASLTPPANAVTNLGNSRTGGEINQLAVSQVPTSQTQWVQTYQHIVQVSGVMQDIQGFPWPGNTPAPFPKNKLDAMQNCMDDIEYSSLYGVGEALSASVSRPKQYGIANLLVTNNKTGTNPTTYKPTDFQADAITPIWANGGRASIIFASTTFMNGLAVWGQGLQRMSPGVTPFGVDIETYYSPFVGPIPIIPNMWLQPGTALVLTGEEVRFRVLKDVEYQPYGRRGDTGSADNNGEGDWIGRLAIEVDNEAHHAYIKGVTAFAPAA